MPKATTAKKSTKSAIQEVVEMDQTENPIDVVEEKTVDTPVKKIRQTKKHKYLRSLGIVRPPTDFQLWGEAVKDELRKDIETGNPPPERLEAYKASLSEKNKCNLNAYRGKLWRPVEEGGFGYVTPDQRQHWQNVYQENRVEWKKKQDSAMEDYPKRPPTPYFCFYEKHFIGQFLEKFPGTALPDIARAASKEWEQNKDTAEFQKYYEEAERLKKEYMCKKEAYDAKMSAENPDWNKPAVPAAKKTKKSVSKDSPKKAIQKKSTGQKSKANATAAAAKKGTKKQMAKTAKILQQTATNAAAATENTENTSDILGTVVECEEECPVAMAVEE